MYNGRQVEASGIQVRNHAGQSIHNIQGVLNGKRDKWRKMGDKPGASRVYWETSRRPQSCGQRSQSVVGDNRETSAKSCGSNHSEHPECTVPEDKRRQAGDKLEITRAENPECSGRQLRDKWETSLKSCRQRIQTQLAEKWETSAKSCEPKHAEHPDCPGRQVGDKWRQVEDKPEIMWGRDDWQNHAKQSIQSIQSVLGDKWETSLSRGDKVRNHADQSTQSTQSVLGDK